MDVAGQRPRALNQETVLWRADHTQILHLRMQRPWVTVTDHYRSRLGVR